MASTIALSASRGPRASDERLWELYNLGLSFRAIQQRTGRNYHEISVVIRSRYVAASLPVPNFRVKRLISFTNAFTGKASRAA